MKKTILGALAALAFAFPASATTPFDGQWTVDILVQRGACDEGRSFPVRIENGRLVYDGTAGIDATGTVAKDGAISARFSRGAETLSASGRIAGTAGTGTWTAPSRDCAGQWQARRL